MFSKLDAASAAPLFNQLLDMDSVAYSVALDVMGMFVHGNRDRLEELRPQIMLAVKHVGKRPKRSGSQMSAHHFEHVVAWLLKKGRDDADARVAAGKLANYLAASPDGGRGQDDQAVVANHDQAVVANHVQELRLYRLASIR